MIRRPPRSTQSRSSAASDVYKRQAEGVPTLVRKGLAALRPKDTDGDGAVEEKAGILQKRNRHGRFQKRFFTVSRAYLTYTHTAAAGDEPIQVRGSIDLRCVDSVVIVLRHGRPSRKFWWFPVCFTTCRSLPLLLPLTVAAHTRRRVPLLQPGLCVDTSMAW